MKRVIEDKLEGRIEQQGRNGRSISCHRMTLRKQDDIGN
jgi:hypothetical protein